MRFPRYMQFNSPVEVNWEYMDSNLMQRFWENHQEERADVASISDRILVFHRGISTVNTHGALNYTFASLPLVIIMLCMDHSGDFPAKLA